MNRVILMGNIANDVELKQTQGGKFVTNIRVACRRSQNETDFINCTAFDKTAELISKHFRKGSRILVEGSIKTGSYDDNQTGKKVFTTDVWISNIDFPEKAHAQNGTQPQAQMQPVQGQPAPNAPAPPPAYNQQGYQPQPAPQDYPNYYDYGNLPY